MGRAEQPPRCPAGSVFTVLVLAVATHPLQAASPEFLHVGKPDRVGGYASTHIVVRFTPAMMQRLAVSPNGREAGGAIPQAALTGDLRTECSRWTVRRMRPLYPFPFSDPPQAARYGFDRTFVVEVPRGSDTRAMSTAFRAFGADIEAAGVDTIGGISELIPNDPDFVRQHALYNTGQTGGTPDADIDAPEAWATHTGHGGATVVVAVIDGGVTPHPEFADRMVPGINTISPETPDHTIDGCGFGHGTCVAGIVAALGNDGVGMAGITWGARIMPVRVLNFCAGPASAAAAGLLWAVDNGADVCNLSLNYLDLDPPVLETFENAVQYAHDNGVVVVAAAGNLSGGCDPGEVAYPGAFDHAIAVSATDRDDQFASFSCFGPEVEISAPGDDILSALVTQGYLLHHGTSVATPHVTGVAALLKSFLPNLGPDDIRTILQDTADDLGEPGWDQYFGHGRLNAHGALAEATTRIAVVSSSPPDGAIDARIPHPVDDPETGFGWDSVDITFTCHGVNSITSADLSITEEGGDGVPPGIRDLTVLANDTLRITLDAPLEPRAWTVFEHVASGASISLGFLPADVDGNGTSNVSDVLALVDCLGGVGPCAPWQCDIDRRGVCAGADLQRLLDLLNGAGAADAYAGAMLYP